MQNEPTAIETTGTLERHKTQAGLTLRKAAGTIAPGRRASDDDHPETFSMAHTPWIAALRLPIAALALLGLIGGCGNGSADQQGHNELDKGRVAASAGGDDAMRGAEKI